MVEQDPAGEIEKIGLRKFCSMGILPELVEHGTYPKEIFP